MKQVSGKGIWAIMRLNFSCQHLLERRPTNTWVKWLSTLREPQSWMVCWMWLRPESRTSRTAAWARPSSSRATANDCSRKNKKRRYGSRIPQQDAAGWCVVLWLQVHINNLISSTSGKKNNLLSEKIMCYRNDVRFWSRGSPNRRKKQLSSRGNCISPSKKKSSGWPDRIRFFRTSATKLASRTTLQINSRPRYVLSTYWNWNLNEIVIPAWLWLNDLKSTDWRLSTALATCC